MEKTDINLAQHQVQLLLKQESKKMIKDKKWYNINKCGINILWASVLSCIRFSITLWCRCSGQRVQQLMHGPVFCLDYSSLECFSLICSLSSWTLDSGVLIRWGINHKERFPNRKCLNMSTSKPRVCSRPGRQHSPEVGVSSLLCVSSAWGSRVSPETWRVGVWFKDTITPEHSAHTRILMCG